MFEVIQNALSRKTIFYYHRIYMYQGDLLYFITIIIQMKILYHFFTFLLLIKLCQPKLNQFYDNIIVGAGIAGIGASMVLSNNSARHLLIQARNRIGGRIVPFRFANTTQEAGASYIQLPRESNLVDPFVTAFNITKIPSHFDQQIAWYVNKSICQVSDLSKPQVVFQALVNYIIEKSATLPTDKPVSQLVHQFWRQNTQYNGFIKDRVAQRLQIGAIDNGAQLNTISAQSFQPWSDQTYKYDYQPKGGYSSLLHRMFSTYCTPILHLKQCLQKVDYSGTTITVYTNLATYTTNKLFIALPIGVLKENKIKFYPPLPNDKAQAIKSIGNGFYQRLYVTFSQPFWPANKSGDNLNFIAKNVPNRYVQALIVPEAISSGLNMLIYWIAGDLARQITLWSVDRIKADLTAYLANFIPKPVTITNLYLTNWEHDPYTLGGFSYSKVGTKAQDFINIKKVLTSGKNRIWFIGEYVDPDNYSFSHGAFKTGLQAGTQSL